MWLYGSVRPAKHPTFQCQRPVNLLQRATETFLAKVFGKEGHHIVGIYGLIPTPYRFEGVFLAGMPLGFFYVGWKHRGG